MADNSLKDKKIIISAGASGIGWATAKICLSRGAIVFLCDINNVSLRKLYKNPLKNKAYLNLNKRLIIANQISTKEKYIKVRFYEDKIKSNKTIDLINYLKKNESLDINFIMGADNLINFHKWYNWKLISEKCNILVFDRSGYKAKSLKSISFKRLNTKRLAFVNFKKVHISSSQIRKI